MSACEFSRAHLEALALAYTLLDPDFGELLDDAHLSPAASALIDLACTDNTLARAALEVEVTDEFRYRLARRAFALSLDELVDFPRGTVVELLNRLPIVGAERARTAA